MQVYFAKSMFRSSAFWVNAIGGALEILQLTELLPLFPPNTAQYRLVVIAILNILLRRLTVRPARFIAPNEVEAVAVKSLPEAPPPKPDQP